MRPNASTANGEPALNRTPLHSRHLELGGNMAPFAGWDMPLWYKTGAIREHLAVVQAAGLFDTSHMDVLFVEGRGGLPLLDHAFTRPLADAKAGRAVYGAFLSQAGHCLDDALVYPLDADRFVVAVNAGMGEVIGRHLRGLPQAAGVTVREPEPRIAKIDIQGPVSPAVLGKILDDPAGAFEKLPYFTFKGDFDFSRSGTRLDDGTRILLSRTGYTGELGFEIFLPVEKAGEVWDRLVAAGQPLGLLPCGLAARDSLRTGAVLPLSHQDIGDWPFVNHPWTFALPYAADGSGGFTKAFIGSDGLDAVHSPYTVAFVGYDARRVDPASARVLLSGREVGTVLTIVSDMAIGWLEGRIAGLATPELPAGWKPRGLACGFVKIDARLEPGTKLVLKDARREIEVETTLDIRPNRSARRKLTFAV